MAPKIQGDTLTYQQGDDEQTLIVGTTAWYTWLETASTFSFDSDAGTFTARHEQAGNKRGGRYWRAYRKQQGKLSTFYLGKSASLTLERLYTVAQALANIPDGAKSAGQRLPDISSNHADKAGKLSISLPPTGTVTLLFTDIEESTQLLQRLGDRYALVIADCRAFLRETFQQWSGHEVDMQGDAFFVAFARATDAVSAAVAAQRRLVTCCWPEGAEVRVRMSLHTGEPEYVSGGYVGLDVHYAARLLSAAHGGQVLLSWTTQELVTHDLPQGVSLRDLGLYHLKDFRDPKRLFQLVVAGLPADFPPLRTIENQFHNLPVQFTSVIGRDGEITAVCALLQREEVRLVTLTGTGGIGKTRLAIEVAARQFDTFADGVAFVSLAPIIHPGLVLHTIAHTLGLVHPHRGQFGEYKDNLKAFLRDRHVLLLLDNFEHVVSAASNLTDLLLACPHLKLLVTSRAVLRMQGEYEFVVPPLAHPRRPHLPDIDVLAQYASVALFLERMLAIKPDMALTKANMQAIATICVHLDGLPLAIELAAARVKLLPTTGSAPAIDAEAPHRGADGRNTRCSRAPADAAEHTHLEL